MSYTPFRSEHRFWLADASSRGPFRNPKGLRIGTEVDMDTHSPDARALIWTGYFMGAVAVIGLIAYFVLA